MSMQGGQLLPYVDCARGYRTTAVAALTATVLALLAAVSAGGTAFDQPGRFACAVASLLAVLLAFATLLQAIAGIMLTGCER